MNRNNCNINHITSEYNNIDFYETPKEFGYAGIRSIFLDNIGAEIYLLYHNRDNKFIIELILYEPKETICFVWYGNEKDFDNFIYDTEEYKFLEEFLLFAESITDKKALYAKRKHMVKKYNLR